jgi:3-hydroxybutyrate dehydrogenase
MSNKVALITGSTSGIGLGIARKLATSGYDIVLNGFGDDEEIESIRISLEKSGIKAIYINKDLTDPEEAKQLVTEAEIELGRVDVLVNNAGIQHKDLIEDFPDDKWQMIINLNLSSAFYTTKAAMMGMKERGFGRIINIASAHGLVASEEKAGYVAAKHGIIGLTKVVALETAQLDITCNAICPGWVLTPLVQKQIDDWAARDGISVEEAGKQLLGEKQPSLQFVTPEEIGDMVNYLCGEAAKSVTGTTISIDGGWTAQ